jgi:hypothetical protein
MCGTAVAAVPARFDVAAARATVTVEGVPIVTL